MATDVSDSFINQYEREAFQTFQRRGAYLLPTVTKKSGVKGSALIFQVMGQGVATTKSRHGTITPMNVTHTPVTLTLADFYAGDWADKLDLEKLNIDERGELQKAAAAGLGRKIDNQILTELDSTTQTAVTVTVTSFAAIRSGFLTAVRTLMSNNVQFDGDVWGVFTPILWAQLMSVDQFIRADYNGPSDLPFVDGPRENWQGRFRSWLGVHWQAHTDCPGIGSATAKGFVYHRSAVGYGYSVLVEGMDSSMQRTDITWHGDRQAWFIAQCMSGECQLIDDLGVIETNHDDTANLATS